MDHPTPPHTPLAEAMVHEHKPMITRKGVPIDSPDKGTGFSRFVAVLLAIIFASGAILWQNSSEDIQRTILRSPPPPAPVELTANDPAPGVFGFTDLYGRMFLKMSKFYRNDDFSSNSFMKNIDATALTNEDQIRAAIVSAEMIDVDEAISRLNSIQAELVISDLDQRIEDTHPLITRDLDVLRTIYEQGPDQLSDDDRVYIATRYDMIGETALTFGMSDNDPARKPLISGIMAQLVVFSLLLIFAVLIGFALLITGIIMMAMGKIRMSAHQPTRGGSVFLETYALFVGAFLAYVMLASFIEHRPQHHQYLIFVLPAQWMLLVIAFWGLIRGMNFTRWRHAIGLHSGNGVFKEIGCGILAYLASIPLFLIGALITFVLLMIQELLRSGGASGTEEVSLPANPIFDMIAKGDTLTIVLIFTLATIWAPLCEELIFRGALFRHLRGYLHWTLAALVSALLFAFLHSYGPLMVTPLVMLGFMFAFMRQWRGSLIAPMTAHFVHNFSVLTVTLILVMSLT